jgi:hypothetical protein
VLNIYLLIAALLYIIENNFKSHSDSHLLLPKGVMPFDIRIANTFIQMGANTLSQELVKVKTSGKFKILDLQRCLVQSFHLLLQTYRHP